MRFAAIADRSALKAKMIHNIREGRVPHAQLILGPRGSGILPLALAYATYLLCRDQQASDSCGVCPSCLQAAKLAHPDLHLHFPIYLSEGRRTCSAYVSEWRTAVLREPFLDEQLWREGLQGENKQLRMGVDVAAEINHTLGLRAHQGGWKVILIWLPERMDAVAANKLLKSLEEPEPRTLFLMVSHDAEHLLPTILSRTQLIKVPALSHEAVEQELLARLPDLDPKEARSVAVRSGGDLLEALALVHGGDGPVFELFRDWLRACYSLKVPETQGYADAFHVMGRERQKGLIRYGMHAVRSGMLQGEGAGQLVHAEGEELRFSMDLGRLLDTESTRGIHQELEKAHAHLERNANPKVLFMDLSYRMHELLRG